MAKRNERKEALDRQTAYLTFLPHMDEGFHTGYHSQPGLISDRNQRPGEWLESLARYMQTPGEDVGFSIPDVLAGEQQLKRLSRLRREDGLAHQPMKDCRALLALLLLWDLWPQDESWPLLELRDLAEGQTVFSQAVASALSPARAPEGLWAFTLRMPHSTEGEARPIALLSRSLILSPAADPGDLSPLLPPCVTWYDRKEKRWMEPCGILCETDALHLRSHLALLRALNELPAYESPLYDPEARLCALLTDFSDDLLSAREPWRQRLEAGEQEAMDELRLRLLAAFTLPEKMGVSRLTADVPSPDGNLLLRHFMGKTVPALPAEDTVFYVLNGQPFAVGSAACLVEPVRSQGEEQILSALRAEIEPLQAHDAVWRTSAAEKLTALSRQLKTGVGHLPRLPAQLQMWAEELSAIPAEAVRQASLRYPMESLPAATLSLVREAIGLDVQSIRPFSDCLSLLAQPCESAKPLSGTGPARYALPPLSPELCAWLMDCAEKDDLYAPHLDGESLSFALSPDGCSITVRFSISRRQRGEGAALSNSIFFEKNYVLADTPRADAAVLITDPPQVTVWPNVRLAPSLWRAYYLFAAHPAQLDAWALSEDGWVQGELHQRGSQHWQTARVSRFPAYVALRRGGLSLGALANDLPRHVLKRESACAIAVDFGSISTTVMLRQGEQVQHAVLPEGLHATLLSSPTLPEDVLGDLFLPSRALKPGSPATFYSVMDLFTDQPEMWQSPLQDGHIYYRESLTALADKASAALYYDLKWGEEEYARRCLRLFLKQVLLQALLAARLWGSDSASFRASMPNAMPLHRREAYLEMLRGLSRELSAETGMPLTPGVPAVLYASENQADGLYFKSRSEVNAQNGYLNLDIGGGTTDISLWLNGGQQASVECSLRLGCRQMLFDSLLERHRRELEADFATEQLRPAVQRVVHAYETEDSTLHGHHKCLLLMDDLFASYAEEIRQCMGQARSVGRISYVESLLLFHIGFLFALSGEMLERAYRDEQLRPLLPQRMELCIAGNGGQLVKAFSDEQRTRLCALALSRLSREHPLQLVLPVQSRHPKQEAARGLLYDDACLQSAIQGADRWNGTFDDGQPAPDLLMDYLPAFYQLFPQAAQRLMPRAFDENREACLNAASRMELDTIRANQQARFPRDDLSLYAACFTDLKRLWNI